MPFNCISRQSRGHGCDTISKVPYSRWDIDGDMNDNKFRARFGSFLRNVDKFDPSLFGITTSEAELMDPQQRLLLEVRPTLNVVMSPCLI